MLKHSICKEAGALAFSFKIVVQWCVLNIVFIPYLNAKVSMPCKTSRGVKYGSIRCSHIVAYKIEKQLQTYHFKCCQLTYVHAGSTAVVLV